LLIFIPLLLPNKKPEYVSEGGRNPKIRLGNNFSVGILKLPIDISRGYKSVTLKERLLFIKNEVDKLRNSIDVLVSSNAHESVSYFIIY